MKHGSTNIKCHGIIDTLHTWQQAVLFDFIQ